jgi:16S rRNA (adenine1518-N6/adenine1519-N6)-dimethyltransferase
MNNPSQTLINRLSALPSLKTVIDAFGLDARKSLGQHFLLDTRITDKIARYAGDLRDFNVIEIGPGPGGLTRSLLTAGCRHLVVVEKDDRCLAALAQIKEIAGDRMEILHGDAMEFDPVASVPAPRKIIANLPYNVGTPLLVQWLGLVSTHGHSAFDSLTLMFQKEVAERIVAEPGTKDFGRLAVLCQWLCECRYDFELPPGAFSPPPKVSSAVVTLSPRKEKLVNVSQDALEAVVAKAFGQRRKMLRSALKGLAVPADKLLEAAGIDGSQRAEQLDVITLCRLAQTYQQLLANQRP